MRKISVPQTRLPSSRGLFLRSTAFTLLELLAVMATMAVMMALIVPAFSGIKGAHEVTRAAYDVAGILEQARTYAIANNTYVWVGFFEEDGTKSSAQPATVGNGGRIVLSVVASQDGSRYSDATIDDNTPAAFGAGAASNPVKLTQINKLVKLDGIRMVAVNAAGSNVPERPDVPAAYQVGEPQSQPPGNANGAFALHVDASSKNPTSFVFPLGSASPQYTFSKIIEFNPRGEASKIVENVFTGPGPQNAIEIALQPMRGNAIDPKYMGQTKAAAAIQVEGLTGQVRMFRL